MRMGGMLRRTDTGIDASDFGRPFDWGLTKRMWAYAKPYWRRFLISMVLMCVYTGANVMNPYFVTIIIDDFIVPKRLNALSWISLAYVGVNLLQWWAQYGQLYLMTYVGEWALYQVGRDMFWNLQRLSMSFYDRNEAGRIMSRIQNDVSVLQQTLSSGIIATLAGLLTLAGIVVALLSLNVRLALIVLMAIPLMAAILGVWQRYAIRSFRRARTAISAVNANLQENVSGVRVIQSLAREGTNLVHFRELNGENLDANLATGRVTAIIQPIIELVSALATAVVVIVGGDFVFHHELTVGVLVGFTLYITRFFDPIRQVTMQFTQLQRSTVSAERIFEILDEKPAVTDAPGATALPPIEGHVRFDDAGFEYVPGVPVLKHFSLDVQPGQTVALVGHTGAGKSTIISLLARFYDVTGGAITIDGYDLRSVTMESLRSQLGMVLQEPFLFSGTVRDNIRYGRPTATDAEIEEAAKVVGVHELIVRLDRGYDTPVRERGSNLSVGERQLIGFARAIIAQPRILILDEATANIDSFTERLIQQGVERLLRGRTAFVIAHRLATIKNADVIVVMREGEIVEQGTHQELIASQGHYRQLYSMGFREVGTASTATG